MCFSQPRCTIPISNPGDIELTFGDFLSGLGQSEFAASERLLAIHIDRIDATTRPGRKHGGGMTMRLTALSASLATAVLGLVHSASAAIWINETNLPAELDFCNLQFPYSFTGSAGTSSPAIYGRVYEAGVTDPAGPSPLLSSQIGYGPAGSDPRTSPGWVWGGASFNVQLGNDEEYASGFILPAINGTYSYTFRFSLDGGNTLTAADIDGAGSNVVLTFSPSQQGTFTVINGLPAPEPTALSAIAAAGLLAVRRRR